MAKQTFTVGQVLTAAQMTSLQQTAMGGGSTTAKTASYVLVAADAGTVVQMNSASATTITVNTALFAAGDTVQIQNVGAGVCTVTAGTATVSTSATLALKQYDAGSLYFNTTSAAIFFAVDAADTPLTTTGDIIYSSSGSTAARLGIGSSAQVLTVASGIPSWATPASGGKVLQVVMGTTATGVSNSTGTAATTGLTASITPTLNTSKVLVIASQMGCRKSDANSANGLVMSLFRDASSILSYSGSLLYTATALQGNGAVTISYLDSPATTSSTTYTTKFANQAGSAASVSVQANNETSTIILLEIGA